MGSGSAHQYSVQLAPKHRYVGRCTCGWTSEPAPAAGIAGAMWDEHVRLSVDHGPVTHRLLAAVRAGDGFRLECACAWVSDICPTADDLLTFWDGHRTGAESG
jgi:hypothetical protein